jgi:3-oxoacyl-[acyl-carrier protein] reductase
MRLEGKVAIVTGGGRGIGRAVALRFAAEGASLVVAERDEAEGEAVAAAIRDQGGQAVAVVTDVKDKKETDRMVQVALRQFGGLHIAALIAGITRNVRLHKMTREDWDEVIAVHLTGTFSCLQAVIGPMMEQRYGRIVNTSSAAGIHGILGGVNYNAAKAGIIAMTKSAARELGSHRITVNCVAPAAKTRLLAPLVHHPKLGEEYLARIPLGYWAEPEEIAPVYAFLASDEARYVTGQTIGADGGLSMGPA